MKLNKIIKKPVHAQRHWRDNLRSLPAYLILRKSHFIGLIVLCGVLAVGVSMVAYLLLTSPTPENTEVTNQVKLNTEALDYLELWLEERETERATQRRLPERDYFATPRAS